MAVKKKATVKKVAKKAPAKKAVAKKSAPKKVAKKAVAKKSVAKKSTAKKAAPKKVAKKAVAKKAVAKKSTVKKGTAKKAVAKKVAKKAPARKIATSTVVSSSTASSDRVNVSTTPITPAKPVATTSKPSAAPRQGSSKSVLVAVILGVAILTGIVASQQSKSKSDTAPAPTPTATATESASPEATATATESASPAASTDTTNAATTGEAPSRFIGNWKDAEHTVLVLSWKAPAGDVTGYKVEIAPNGTGWTEVSQLPATSLKLELTKTSADKYTSFRVSAIYADGTLGVAKAFGFAGQFE